MCAVWHACVVSYILRRIRSKLGEYVHSLPSLTGHAWTSNIQFLKIPQELGHMPYCMQHICVNVSNDKRYLVQKNGKSTVLTDVWCIHSDQYLRPGIWIIEGTSLCTHFQLVFCPASDYITVIIAVSTIGFIKNKLIMFQYISFSPYIVLFELF
jgi:hypothetical protein